MHIYDTDDTYKDIADDIETRFDNLNYELDRLFPIGKNKKAIKLMKDELGRKIMKKFVGLRAKTYSHLIDNGEKDKKANDTKMCHKKKN